MESRETFEKLKLAATFILLAALLPLSLLSAWPVALAHIFVAFVWFCLSVKKPRNGGVFFWLVLIDLFFLIYQGIGKAYLSGQNFFPELCFILLVGLLVLALFERVPSIFRKSLQPRLPGLLIFSALVLSLAVAFAWRVRRP